MKKNRDPFLYADKTEQIKSINQYLMIVYGIFYVFFIWLMVISRWLEKRPLLVVIAFSVSCLAALGIDIYVYVKDRKSEKLRVVAFIGLFVISVWASVIFTGAYLKFMSLIPLILCVFYYDTNFTTITSVCMIIAYQGITLVDAFLLNNIADENMMEEFFTSAVIILVLVIVMLAERIGKQFNEDALGKVWKEKEAQRKMMEEVIEVAAQIRKETEGAKTMVHSLSESTGLVSNAMSHIYSSTQNTAESIETQTSMTQNIQNAIEQTIHYSENVVGIAQESKEQNMENMKFMQQLQKSSNTISSLNINVAQLMESLMERTIAVKGISDTIFSISSQTNLLALNASIESARAGEAGRGFAVVADEIRQLAEKTRVETENIASVLQELSENAEGAMQAVTQSVEAAKEEETQINQAFASFENINLGVNKLNDNITQVNQMLEDLSASNNQIVDNITQLSATTEEVTASSMEAENLSNQNLEDAEKANHLLESILEISRKLDGYIAE